jgi:hypothetical protein
MKGLGRAAGFPAAVERGRRLDITADAYPYDAGQNALDSGPIGRMRVA